MKNYQSKNIKLYLKDIINNLQKSDNWKNQLTIAILLKKLIKGMKCIQSVITYKADNNIKELFELLLNRYQIGLEISMRASDFIFNCVVCCLTYVIK